MTSGLVIPSPTPTAHILLRWLMVAQAHKDDAIEGSVGLAIAPSIEPMAVGPAR